MLRDDDLLFWKYFIKNLFDKDYPSSKAKMLLLLLFSNKFTGAEY